MGICGFLWQKKIVSIMVQESTRKYGSAMAHAAVAGVDACLVG